MERAQRGPALRCQSAAEARRDWRVGLPVLRGRLVTLREVRPADAASLFMMLTTDEVTQFITPPPASVEGFERFIDWMVRGRAMGKCAGFAVTMGGPAGPDTAIGLFQVRANGLREDTAELGVAIGSPFWGSGFFEDGATLVVDFVFDTLGAHRLEARADVANTRGGAALLKIGAVHEGILRRSFLRRGEYHDQALYAIVDDDWRTSRHIVETAPIAPASQSVH